MIPLIRPIKQSTQQPCNARGIGMFNDAEDAQDGSARVWPKGSSTIAQTRQRRNRGFASEEGERRNRGSRGRAFQ